jgi:hypothetical protein
MRGEPLGTCSLNPLPHVECKFGWTEDPTLGVMIPDEADPLEGYRMELRIRYRVREWPELNDNDQAFLFNQARIAELEEVLGVDAAPHVPLPAEAAPADERENPWQQWPT